jgi:hypothetical protein
MCSSLKFRFRRLSIFCPGVPRTSIALFRGESGVKGTSVGCREGLLILQEPISEGCASAMNDCVFSVLGGSVSGDLPCLTASVGEDTVVASAKCGTLICSFFDEIMGSFLLVRY